MKKEEIMQAINEVDDDLLISAQKARRKHRQNQKHQSMIKTAVILTAAASLIVVISWQMHHQTDNPTTIIEPGRDTEEKTILTLNKTITDGMGMSVVMYPDIKKETDYNPWDISMNLSALPVYEKKTDSNGEPMDLSKEEMLSLLQEYADRFGFQITEEPLSSFTAEGNTFSLTAKTKEAQLSCYADGEITVFFNKEYAPRIPESLKLNVDDLSKEEAEATATYLSEMFGYLLGEDETVWDIGGDFGYHYQPSEDLGEKEGLFRNRHYILYQKGCDDTETILNYAFHHMQIWGYDIDHPNQIDGIRILNKMSAYQETDEYPLISLEEAYEQLLKGYCIANAGGILPDADTETGDVQLVYWDNQICNYALPCYLFMMDITDALKEQIGLYIEGVRQYGLYYVPAIDPKYYKWTENDISEQRK